MPSVKIVQASVRGLFLLFVNCIINKSKQIDRIQKNRDASVFNENKQLLNE